MMQFRVLYIQSCIHDYIICMYIYIYYHVNIYIETIRIYIYIYIYSVNPSIPKHTNMQTMSYDIMLGHMTSYDIVYTCLQNWSLSLSLTCNRSCPNWDRVGHIPTTPSQSWQAQEGDVDRPLDIPSGISRLDSPGPIFV